MQLSVIIIICEDNKNTKIRLNDCLGWALIEGYKVILYVEWPSFCSHFVSYASPYSKIMKLLDIMMYVSGLLHSGS